MERKPCFQEVVLKCEHDRTDESRRVHSLCLGLRNRGILDDIGRWVRRMDSRGSPGYVLLIKSGLRRMRKTFSLVPPPHPPPLACFSHSHLYSYHLWRCHFPNRSDWSASSCSPYHKALWGCFNPQPSAGSCWEELNNCPQFSYTTDKSLS